MKMKVIFVITKLFIPHGVKKGNKSMFLHMDTIATVSLFGAVDIHQEEFLCMEAEHCNAQAFQEFLQYIVNHYEEKRIILILDNAKIHHAKIIQPFLQDHQHQLTLVFLPPYSPNLNAVERIWGWLKQSVIVNRFHATRADIRVSVLSFLDHISLFPNLVLQRIGDLAMSKNLS